MIARPHKISRPLVNRYLERARLFDLLASKSGVPVTAVLAPPGYGKTTLVSSFINSSEQLSVWYGVDEDDADLANFFFYISSAIRQATPKLRKVIPTYQKENAMNVKAFARLFFSAVYQRLAPPFYFVFDDIHECQSQQWADVINVAISVLPPQGRIFLVGRQALPAEFARLNLNQQIFIIREDELRFNNKELQQLAAIHEINSLPIDQCNNIQSLMTGWGAGLALLLTRTKQVDDKEILALNTKQDIFNYFMNEVIRHLSEEIRALLYRTCYLPEVSADLAKILSKNNNASEMLQNLYESNYFTYRVSESGQVFRYHPLFKSFLITQSEKLLDEHTLREVKETTVDLLEKSGALAEAATLLTAMNNWPRFAQFTIQHAKDLVDANYVQTLMKWLQQLPTTIVEQNSWLLYWRAFCFQFIHPQGARRDYITAFNRFSEAGEPTGQCLSLTGVIYSYIFERDDFSPLDSWISKVDQLQPSLLEQAPKPVMMSLTMSMFSALIHRAPHHKEFSNWLDRVNQIPKNALPPALFVLKQVDIILYYLWRGDFFSAEISHDIFEKQIKQNHEPTSKMLWHVVHCFYLWFAKGEAERALTVAKDGLKLGKEHGLPLWDILLLNMGAAAALTSHNAAEATRLLDSASQIADDSRRAHLTLYQNLMAINCFRRGETALALHHGQESLRYAKESGSPFPHAQAHFILAQLYSFDGDLKEAKRHIDSTREIGIKISGVYHQFQTNLIDATLEWESKQPDAALQHVKNALLLAKKYNLLPGLWVRYDELIRLLMEAMRKGIEPDIARAIIKKCNLVPKTPPYDINTWPWPIRIRTLGRFEIEIDSQQLNLPNRTRPKLYALLKVLVAFGGNQVREEVISETIWPDAEGDAAHQSFDTTLFRLRKLLGRHDVLINREGKLSLNEGMCWLDIAAFDTGADRLMSLLKNKTAHKKEIKASFNHIDSYYKGDFLQDEDEYSIVLQFRERMRSKWSRLLSLMADYWIQQHQLEEALRCLEKLISANPLHEDAYRKLMALHISQGQFSQAAVVYDACKKVLFEQLGVSLSSETELVFNRIKKEESDR